MDVLTWLLDGDPSIRWQALDALTDAPSDEVGAERARVAQDGWGALLLAQQGADGLWHRRDEPRWVPNFYAMQALHDLGVDPADPIVAAAVDRLDAAYRWDDEFGAKSFFSGEVEPCINGRVLDLAVVFDRVDAAPVPSLLDQQLPDGGWNCYAPPSTRGSFASTVNVLEGLASFELARGADPAVSDARRRGEEYLLSRRLFRRRTDGTPVGEEFFQFVFPPGWHYEILRALEYFRRFDLARDERMDQAVAVLRGRAGADGRWALGRASQMSMIDTGDRVGDPSRWITLRALRVLQWWDED